ncbi:MAG: L,D-transpeptidase [Gammaproteobacteria bacterium]|nr:L,D-transpeptidase [Gammaproteobacteria bacterium]
MNTSIKISISAQTLSLYESEKLVKKYTISTAKNGTGEQYGSECTPLGKHIIHEKIGADCLPNTVFVGRKATGEIYSSELAAQHPDRDWVLSRILWLSGMEVGKNRLGQVDTMRRYIYIHGCPNEFPMGVAKSHGCIRMHNQDVIELFESVKLDTKVLISLD